MFDSCLYSLIQVLEEENINSAEISTIQVAEIAILKLMQLSLTSEIEVRLLYNAEVRFHVFRKFFIPLRSRKVGRVWCGGAGETH